MTIPAKASPVLDFCLRGDVGGIEQTFPLRPGENRVGSLGTNEIALPRRGVSRQHAVLRVDGRELVIEDIGSKNGTFVNGRRVESFRIAPGSEIRFGPVELLFQELHRDDTELAIAFEASITDQTSTIPVVDANRLRIRGGSDLSSRWLALAETFHARLFSKTGGDLGAALRLLQEELGLRSACVLEILEDRGAIFLAASGNVDRSAISELERLVIERMASASQDIYFDASAGPDGAELTFAALTTPGIDPLVLALQGEFPGRVRSELLLRLLARMLAPLRPQAERSQGKNRLSRYPDLVVPPDYVYAQSEAMRKIYELMQVLAQGDLPILVIGETGAGKEYLAHILHHSSPRRRGPFIALNCAAIPAELLEAELFGIGERVATGVAASKGRLQLANGGSLFLDEIGDMSPDLQAKLLRALQEKEVHPVGQDPVAVDVRVLAATNQDLRKRIDGGTFRADLYYRLAGYVLEVPPLREHADDIPALVEHFLRDCARELERPIRGLTVHALRLLTEYSWPGNVRELANEVRRAVYLCPEHGTIESATLSDALRNHRSDAEPEPRPVAKPTPLDINQDDESQRLPAPMGLGLDSLNLEHLESQTVREALRRCRQNQVQAAKLLGISRQSLRRRMERLGEL